MAVGAVYEKVKVAGFTVVEGRVNVCSIVASLGREIKYANTNVATMTP
jgi:hypothetical protein